MSRGEASFGTRPARADEIAVVAGWERACYGSASADEAILRAWWRRYPSGVLVASSGEELIGAVGVWPLTSRAFSALCAGDADEVDLKPADVSRSGGGHRHWYLAELILAQRARGRGLSRDLVRAAVGAWAAEVRAVPELEVCALAHSSRGAALLRRLGLPERGLTPKGFPIHRRELSPRQLLAEMGDPGYPP